MKNVVIVDSSIAIKWVLKEPDSDNARSLLKQWTKARTVMLAPALFIYEFTNILHKYIRKGEMLIDEAKEGLEEILSLGVELEFLEGSELSKRALELALQFGLPATYDPHYLALAEHVGCEFWSADARLWRAVKDELPWVHLLAEYHPLVIDE